MLILGYVRLIKVKECPAGLKPSAGARNTKTLPKIRLKNTKSGKIDHVREYSSNIIIRKFNKNRSN